MDKKDLIHKLNKLLNEKKILKIETLGGKLD